MPDLTHPEQPPEAPVPVPTLAVQLDAIAALRALADAFPHLPGVDFSLSRITPGVIDIHVHDGLDVFEAWRAALGVAPEAVDLAHGNLRATTSFCGAEVELIGYGAATAADVEAQTAVTA